MKIYVLKKDVFMKNYDKIDWHSKISDILSRDHDFAGSRDLSDFRIWNDFLYFHWIQHKLEHFVQNTKHSSFENYVAINVTYVWQRM